jgi:hypothetical protein
MTREQRDELRRLAGAATPGAWWPRWGGEPGYVYASSGPGKIVCEARHEMRDDGPRHDSLYIAAAHPQAVLALLDALDAAERERDPSFLVRQIEAARIFERHLKEQAERERDAARAEAERLRAALVAMMNEPVVTMAGDANPWEDRLARIARTALEGTK